MGERLTHDLIHKKLGTKDGWKCVNCGRVGTMAEINAVSCPNPPKDNQNVLDAIAGTGRFKD